MGCNMAWTPGFDGDLTHYENIMFENNCRTGTPHEQHDRLNAMRALVAAFTPRESEVFALVVRGKLNKQIAFELGTSERTVKAHRHNIMEKLQVSSLAEAVSIAERLGIVAAPSGGEKQPSQ